MKVCLTNLAKGSTNFIKTRKEIVIRQETIHSALQVQLAVQVLRAAAALLTTLFNLGFRAGGLVCPALNMFRMINTRHDVVASFLYSMRIT